MNLLHEIARAGMDRIAVALTLPCGGGVAGGTSDGLLLRKEGGNDSLPAATGSPNRGAAQARSDRSILTMRPR